MEGRWHSLRAAAAEELVPLRDLENCIMQAVDHVGGELNSKAEALRAFLSEGSSGHRSWYLVCERVEQVKIAASLFRRLGTRGVEPALLRDVAVCGSCITAGWTSTVFARRLWAHTPRSL